MIVLVLCVTIVVYAGDDVSKSVQITGLQNQLSSAQQQGVAQTSTSVSTVAPTTRYFTLVSNEAKVQIASNVTYDAYTFNGTVPAPTVWVNQGDTVFFKLINNGTMGHSIDFHAAEVNWATDYVTIAPGQSLSFNFTVNYPGVFMYHCGTPPVLEHIANGMYGAIIVNPSTPLPPAPGGQFVLIESEFYLNSHPNSDGSFGGNYSEMLAATPDYVVFNGTAFQFQKAPISVKPNQLVRLFLLNVGPSLWEAFHVIGALMDTVFIDGNPANVMHGLQTLNIPPSGGAIVDMYFRDPGGKNPFVTHAFAYASKGAVGVFSVSAASTTTTTTSTVSAPPGPHVVIEPGAAADTVSNSYSPKVITVVIGVNNTVTWINEDQGIHTVTATDKSWGSGNLAQGDIYFYTFTTPGTYNYYCIYHAWMTGTVIVKSG